MQIASAASKPFAAFRVKRLMVAASVLGLISSTPAKPQVQSDNSAEIALLEDRIKALVKEIENLQENYKALSKEISLAAETAKANSSVLVLRARSGFLQCPDGKTVVLSICSVFGVDVVEAQQYYDGTWTNRYNCPAMGPIMLVCQ